MLHSSKMILFKGTKWTLLNQLSKENRTSWTLSNIWPKWLVQRYLQNTISNLQTSILLWSRPRSATLFWAFFLDMVYISILQKISPERDRLQHFCTFALILAKFSVQMSQTKFCAKKGSNLLTWWVYWMRNRSLLLKFLVPFLTQLTTLINQ